MSSDCIFCKIIQGEAEASIVYQDEVCTAFMDLQPVNPGHVLVIPNEHAAGMSDLPQETGGHLFQVGQKIAAAIRKTNLRSEGINLFLSDGKAAMQEIFHVHLHIIPRYDGDSFKLSFGEDYHKKPDREALHENADKIKKKL